jgi:hypothetical protein
MPRTLGNATPSARPALLSSDNSDQFVGRSVTYERMMLASVQPKGLHLYQHPTMLHIWYWHLFNIEGGRVPWPVKHPGAHFND